MRGAALLELVVATGLMLLLVAALSTAMVAAIRREAILRAAIVDAERATREARQATREIRCAVDCLDGIWWLPGRYTACFEECAG